MLGYITCLYEPLAQSVEHLTFNQVVVGSTPTRLTKHSRGLRFYRDPLFVVLLLRGPFTVHQHLWPIRVLHFVNIPALLLFTAYLGIKSPLLNQLDGGALFSNSP